MFTYIWKSWRTSSTLSVILVAFLIVSVPALYSSLATNKLVTADVLSDYGRGGYDILVRPESSRTQVERQDGRVEENYLTGGMGGISVAQYKQVKEIRDVVVAAPVSVVGLLANNTGGFGYRWTNAVDRDTLYSFYFSNDTRPFHIMSFRSGSDADSLLLNTLPSGSMSVDMDSGYPEAQITFPAHYDLLVGIDQEQEELLIGDLSDRQLPMALTLSSTKNQVPEIPLLVNRDLRSPIDLRIEKREIAAADPQLRPSLEQARSPQEYEQTITKYLAARPVQSKQVDVSSFLKPLKEMNVKIEPDGTVTPDKNGTTSYVSTSRYYVSDRLQYIRSTDAKSDYMLVPGMTGSTQTYRPMTEIIKASANNEPLFSPNVIGEFHVDQRARDLDPSPLGMYSFSPVTLIEDANGNPVNTVLQKGLSPDTFLPIQAAALTNLDAALYLKGDKPIDAIRVRVNGEGGYSPALEQKVLQVAKQIQDETGLHTDIVAGASKQAVKVSVPEVGEKPAVGVVSEIWTSLGVAVAITRSTNLLSLWILVFLAILIVLFAVVQTRTQIILRRRELTTLQAIGWKAGEIRKLLMKEWVVKILLAYPLAAVLLGGLKSYLNLQQSFAVMLLLALLPVAVLLAALRWSTGRLRQDQLRPQAQEEWSGVVKHPRSVWGLAGGNFRSQFVYNVWNILLIVVSGSLSLLTFNLVLAEQRAIGRTFLGAAVHAEGQTLLLTVVLATTALTVYGLWEANRTYVTKRETEMTTLRIIGWTKGDVRRLVLTECLLVLATGIGLAFGIGSGGFRLFYQEFAFALIWQIGMVLLLLAGLTGFAAVYIQRTVSRIHS